MTTPRKRSGRTRSGRGAGSRRRAATVAPTPVESGVDAAPDVLLEPPDDTPVSPAPAPPGPTAEPERAFAARVPPPEPERPRPTTRRVILFDVENSSRFDHVSAVLSHLRVDRATRLTELVAVGNWRVVSAETARLLAAHGAQLVHSAPATGVRDWSDLRIAVTAGVWLASARAGDTIEIITDDQAFDAVGDVAMSLGVEFRRLSFRALAGITGEDRASRPAPVAAEGRSRRRRRGGRGRRSSRSDVGPAHAAPSHPPAPRQAAEPADQAHTAPHDELLAVARELIGTSAERLVSLDALSNALKAHGFRRPPGSPRLITRLRRIKELEVTRGGQIRLVEGGGVADRIAETPALAFDAPGAGDESALDVDVAGEVEGGTPSAATEGERPQGRRRRRRRGGRGRRRGRGGAQPAVAAP